MRFENSCGNQLSDELNTHTVRYGIRLSFLQNVSALMVLLLCHALIDPPPPPYKTEKGGYVATTKQQPDMFALTCSHK